MQEMGRLLIARILFQRLTDVLQRVFVARHLVESLGMVTGRLVYLVLTFLAQSVTYLI